MDVYLWIKSFHVIADMAWMAGLLYLPRLFVYHADTTPFTQQSETFKIMERRLLRYIMSPALLAAWISGLWLGWQAGYFVSGWFHLKLLLVLAMSGVHGYCGVLVKAFAQDKNQRPARFFRILNEIPTLLMVVIVVLVVVKPF